MVNRITMRDLSDHTLKIIDEEAERNNISRNALLQIVIENFTNN